MSDSFTRTPLRVARLATGVLCLLASAAGAQQQKTPVGVGDHEVQIQVGDQQRSYLFHVPRAYDGAKTLPVVLVLHGGGGSARTTRAAYGWVEKSEEEQFCPVFAEAMAVDPTQPAQFLQNPRLWNDGSGRGGVARRKVDDVGYLRAVLDDLAAKIRVDQQRIFCTGFSNGASMTFRVGIELSDRVAAIAPVSGHLWVKDVKPNRPMSMLFIAGLADPLNPMGGGRSKTPWGMSVPKEPIMNSIQAWAKLIGAGAVPQVLHDHGGMKAVRYGDQQPRVAK